MTPPSLNANANSVLIPPSASLFGNSLALDFSGKAITFNSKWAYWKIAILNFPTLNVVEEASVFYDDGDLDLFRLTPTSILGNLSVFLFFFY